MISYSWAASIPEDLGDELAALVSDAIDYDAEAGFSTADPERPATPGATLHHLLVSMPPKGSRGSPDLDRLPDAGVVAYLRLEVTDGVGEACLVVRPEFRSLGVATLMMERLIAEPEGWAAIEGLHTLRAWSHGAHPAAERMSWRFRAGVIGEIYKTLRLIGGRHPYEPVVAQSLEREPIEEAGVLAPFHDLGIAPADRSTRDRVDVRVLVGDHAIDIGRGVDGELEASAAVEPHWKDDPDKDDVRLVLDTALAEAQATGARIASLYVDTADELVLHVSREIEFFHDQSDRRYELAVDPHR